MKYLALIALLLSVALLLAGCASPNVMLIHPRTGDIRQCAASGAGIYGAGLAVQSVNNCVGQLQALGYKRADELTQGERDQINPTRGPDFKGEYKIR